MARYSILINVPQHKLRNLTPVQCRALRASLCRPQWCQSKSDMSYWMSEMSTYSLVCVYTTAFSSNDTYLKKRCVGWLDDSNIILGCTDVIRAGTHKTTFCRRPRWCLQCSAQVSGSYLQYSTRYRLLSIYFCHSYQDGQNPAYDAHYTHIYINYCCSTYFGTFQSV